MPPTIEVTRQPWFGPTSRAREILSKHRRSLLSPELTVGAFGEVLGAVTSKIQHIRFIDFFHKVKKFHFSLAICWLDSDPDLRQLLYDLAPRIVEASGWYPLPQGERLSSVRQARHIMDIIPQCSLPNVGSARLKSVEKVGSGGDGGCCIRVALDDGSSLLLDSGLPGRLSPSTGDRLVLVSHVHLDHIGGLTSGAFRGLPAVLSPGSALLLEASGRLASLMATNPVHVVRPGDSVRLGDSLSCEVFSVPHMPGSVGFLLADGHRSLLYSGDIAMKTARHNFLPTIQELATKHSKTLALLDSTMAGRTGGASTDDPGAAVLAEEAPNTAIIGESSEHLLYAYLDLFHQVQRGQHRHSISFLVTGTLRPVFSVLHDTFIRREHAVLDPFVLGQYRKTMSSWAESRWLFWLDTMAELPDGRHLWFLTKQELERTPLPEGTILAPVGRVAISAPGPVMDLDTSAWTLHSNGAVLVDGVRTLSQQGVKVALFHNFSKRIRKFVAQNSLDASPISKAPFVL